MKAKTYIHPFLGILIGLLFAFSGNVWGATATWTYKNGTDGLSDKSPISVTYGAGSAANSTTVTGDDDNRSLRLYQHKSDGDGSWVTFTAGTGYQITAIEVVFSDKRTTARGKIDSGSWTEAFSSGNSNTVSITSLTATSYSIKNGQNSDANAVTVKIASITITYAATGNSITLDKNGGDSNGSATVAADATTLSSISAPTRTGYTVEGYYTNAACTTKVATAAGALQANITVSVNTWTNGSSQWKRGADETFYTKWTANSYTVKFDKNGGDTGTGTADQSFTYGTSQSLRTCGFTAPAHKYFIGWNTDKDASTALYEDGESVSNLTSTKDGTVTLYAIWKSHKYKNYRTRCCIQHNIALAGSGTVTGGTIDADPVKACEGETVALMADAATGYTFTEWVITDSGDDNITEDVLGSGNEDEALVDMTMPNDDVTIDATFTANTYTVTFDKNGGSTNGSATATYNSSTLSSVSHATRTGEWALVGYFTATSDGDKVINANGTLVADVDSYTDEDGNWIYDDDVTLYAQWRSTSTYRVTITSTTNGSISVTYTGMGSALTSGYRDIEKNTVLTISATADDYYELATLTVNGSDFTSGSTLTLTKDTTIAATFSPIDYSITYSNMTGATNAVGNPSTYNVEDDDIVFDEPTKEGYTFDGWYYDNGVWSEEAVGIESGSHGAVTVYAKWTVNSYKLTWVTDGDALTGSYTKGDVNYGTSITAPNTPTKTGYTFAGWSPSSPASTMPAANTTYTATWTINNYTVTWKVNDEAYTAGYPSTSADYNTKVSSLPTRPANNALSSCANKFMGWSKKNYTYTEGMDDSDYDDLFTDRDGSPKITENTIFYAVFAEQICADANTVVWSEDFSSYSNTDVPSGGVTTTTGRKVYNDGKVTYTCTNGTGSGAGTTKVTTDNNGNLAEGTSPELMVAKKGSGDGDAGGTFIISGIPTTGASELTLSYKQNAKRLIAVTGTGYSDTIISANTKATQTGTINCSGSSSITLKFEATTSDNVRLDDIVLKVKSAIYVNYVTQCNPDNARVDYNANGGTTTCVSGSKPKEDFVLCDDEPERIGYEFKGWRSSEDGKDYAAEAEYELEDDVTFTAQWSASKYTINYYDQDGDDYSGTNEDDLVKTHTYDASTALVDGDKGAGYNFDGWFTNSACTGDPITSIGATDYSSGPISLYAKWTTKKAVSWTVVGSGTTTSYFMPDGSLTFPSPNPSVPAGSKVFVGWTGVELECEEDDEPTLAESGCAVSNDTSYYAVFAASNGGTPIAAVEDDDFSGTGEKTVSSDTYCGVNNKFGSVDDYVLKQSIWTSSNMTNVKVRIKIYHICNTSGGKSADVYRISLINSSGSEVVGADYTATKFGSASQAAGYSTYVELTPTTAVTGYKVSLKTKKSNGSAVAKVTREVRPIYSNYATDCHCKEFMPVGSSTSWGTSSNWSAGDLPTILDKVIVAKPVTVDVVNAKAKEIILNQTTGNTGKLNIQANKALEVTGTITRTTDGSNSLATRPEDLILESSSAGNATLIFDNSNSDQATVYMYSKGWTTGTQNSGTWNWQLIGTPVTDATRINDYYGGYMYKWSSSWVDMTNTEETLTPFAGYSATYPTTSDKLHTYEIDGTLVATGDKSIAIPANTSVMAVANSWTAPIYVKNITFTNCEPANIYIFNTGYAGSGTPATKSAERFAAGTYHAVPVNSSPYTGDSLIASMQGFYVRNTTANNGTMTINYDDVVRPSGSRNITAGEMHAPKRTKPNEEVAPVVMKLYVSDTEHEDRVVLLEREDFSRGFDNGWDGEKFQVNAVKTAPRLFAINETGGKETVSAIPEMEGTVIGFRPGTEAMYTITFDYEGSETYYLLDTKTGLSTLICSTCEYYFSSNGENEDARFVIAKSPAVATDVDNSAAGSANVYKMMLDDHIYIIRNGKMYDVTGIPCK